VEFIFQKYFIVLRNPKVHHVFSLLVTPIPHFVKPVVSFLTLVSIDPARLQPPFRIANLIAELSDLKEGRPV